MRIPINLARQPFRRDRAILIASAATGVLLLVSLALLSTIAVNERSMSAASASDLTATNRRLASIRAEQAKLDAELRLPENEVVLDRSVLINEIIRRKGISWTKIFSDLAGVLPHNVRIAVIRPQVTGNDQLSLDMTVESEAPEPVIMFVSNLEGSDVFGSTEVTAIAAPTQSDPVYHYRLSVNYAQKL